MARSNYSKDGSYRQTSDDLMTVEELIAELQKLPGDLPIQCSLGEGVKLVWSNVGGDDECLFVEETDDGMEESDWELRQPT